jgi:hypothetical protein
MGNTVSLRGRLNAGLCEATARAQPPQDTKHALFYNRKDLCTWKQRRAHGHTHTYR